MRCPKCNARVKKEVNFCPRCKLPKVDFYFSNSVNLKRMNEMFLNKSYL